MSFQGMPRKAENEAFLSLKKEADVSVDFQNAVPDKLGVIESATIMKNLYKVGRVIARINCLSIVIRTSSSFDSDLMKSSRKKFSLSHRIASSVMKTKCYGRELRF